MPRHEVYAFGGFKLDVADRRLSIGATTVHLAPKAHDLLVALVRDAGRLVTKQELLSRVWADAFVEEGIIAVHVSSLRKALGDDNRRPSVIETVSRSGYRFIAPVAQVISEGDGFVRETHPESALELVGRGRAHLLSASYFELPDAVSSFQSAIEIDPTYAAAHAGLALARCAQAAFRAIPHIDAYADAKAAALRALAMDAESADAQVALGMVLFLSEWDWLGAERAFKRALELNSGHTEAFLHYGSLMEAVGQLGDGLRLKQQALERDPVSALVRLGIAMSYWHQRRYDEALVWAKRALETDPRHLLARELLVGIHMKNGDFDTVAAENVKQAESFGAPREMLMGIREVCGRLKAAYASGGHAAAARCALREIPEHAADAATIRLVVLNADAGNLDAAFDHLDRAIASRDPSLVHLAVAPQWDALRNDPRFRERLSRLRLLDRHH